MPHEYRRALEEMALEAKAQKEAELRKQDLENEFDEDMISEEDLKLNKDKLVSVQFEEKLLKKRVNVSTL